MTPEQTTELYNQQAQLFEQSLKLKNIALTVSKSKSIVLASVATVEEVENLDDKGKPTGAFSVVVFSQSGHDTELTPDEYKVFKDYWNRILLIDNLLARVNLTLTSALYPQQPAQLAAAQE
jgi:hypothetical protein